MTRRSLLSALNYYKIELQRSLLDDDVLLVLSREVKKHRESIEMYKKAGRADLFEQEEKELNLLLSYMPKQMDAAEVEKIIRDEVDKLKANGADLNPGLVMKTIMPILKGKVDGKVVKEVVDKLLQ